jgi:lipoprotein-anchoring transpeptidase ErfK/SrfK
MTITKLTALLALAAAHALAEEAATTPRHRIVISIPDRKLVLFEEDRVVKLYDVAVGKRSTPSPAGRHQVINRIAHPTWYNHGKPVPPGKKNPLGTRWLGISSKGYGIHGTNAPLSIGKAASGGCIRMRNADVEELFNLIQVGVEVDLKTETPQSLAALIAVAAAD